MIQYLTLPQQDYVDFVTDAICTYEQFRTVVALPRDDSLVTIGYGYTFVRNNNVTLWQAAGISLNDVDLALLQQIDAAPDNQVRNALARGLSRSLTAAEGRALVLQTFPTYEGPARDFLGMPFSVERAALVSLTSNRSPTLVYGQMKPFLNAVLNGDRAEAWFQMRYMSWGSNAASETGLRKRRYSESELFGINNDGGAVTGDEARSVYEMVGRHRDTILTLEGLWGVPPDGSVSTRNLIFEANRDYVGLPAVRTINQSLVPSRDAFVSWVNGELLVAGYGALQSNDWNPMGIYYGRQDLNAWAVDNKAGENGFPRLDHNLLVGGAGADILRGGVGSDTLIGGGGLDTYFYRSGDGNDVVYDSRAKNGVRLGMLHIDNYAM